MAERKTLKLHDGPEVTLRTLNQLDMLDAAEYAGPHFGSKAVRGIPRDRANLRYFLKAAELAMESPRFEIEGLPPTTRVEGVLHVRELSQRGFDQLMDEVRDFALGGARRERFREGSGDESGYPAAGGLPGEEVLETTERDPQPLT